MASPATPRATAPRLATASSYGTLAGSALRIASVASRRSGMNSTARRSRGASIRMASMPSAVAADATNPPRSAAAALSGWPSMPAAIRSCVFVSSGPPSSAFAATMPPTVAAAEDEATRDRDLVMHVDPPADALRQLAPSGAHPASSPPHESVVAILRHLPAALAIDRDLDLAATPATDLDLDAVDDRERDAEAVEARHPGWPTTRAPRRSRCDRRARRASGRPSISSSPGRRPPRRGSAPPR